MADINNLNSGDSSSSYNKYPVGGNNNINSSAQISGGESQAGYSHNWKRMPRPFGMNVRVPQEPLVGVKTQELVKRKLIDIAMAPVRQVVNYFKNNENVFNGSVAAEIKSLENQQKMTIELLQDADETVMVDIPNFMMDM